MNEPSSFVNGTTTNQCRNAELNYPPYFPGTILPLYLWCYHVIIIYLSGLYTLWFREQDSHSQFSLPICTLDYTSAHYQYHLDHLTLLWGKKKSRNMLYLYEYISKFDYFDFLMNLLRFENP